jgi:hypothetical protein
MTNPATTAVRVLLAAGFAAGTRGVADGSSARMSSEPTDTGPL